MKCDYAVYNSLRAVFVCNVHTFWPLFCELRARRRPFNNDSAHIQRKFTMLRSLGDSTGSDSTQHFTIQHTLQRVLHEIRLPGEGGLAHRSRRLLSRMSIEFPARCHFSSSQLGLNPSIVIHRLPAVDAMPSPVNTCLSAAAHPSRNSWFTAPKCQCISLLLKICVSQCSYFACNKAKIDMSKCQAFLRSQVSDIKVFHLASKSSS